MTDCVFCKVVKGEIPSYKVYEDENNLAFLDIKPHSKGHTVIIPKIHAETVFDLDDQKYKDILLVTKKTMKIIQDKLNPDGFNVGWNHNSAGGQVVPHLHVHIFPRYNGDGGGSMHSIVNNPGDLSVEEAAKLFK
tara:strand:- start:201 stop:605 length:405 start_codon:yes stop_codon:yes gene_type:complete